MANASEKRNFWDALKHPFFVQAPMADGTDAAFRAIVAECGKPDVMFTEFVSADGLCHEIGRKKLLGDLAYTEAEHPIVAQLFSGRAEKMEEASCLARELGFDGIDINMGCPDRGIEKSGAGAVLMNNPERAKEIIVAAIRGGGGLPVSVKTRLGYHENIIATWGRTLIESGIVALTVHLRTRKEMSKVSARWDEAAIIAQMAKGTGVRIIGNGDVMSLAEARGRAVEAGVDGVMVGRALFGNPWFFSERGDVLLEERLRVMIRHAQLFGRYFCGEGEEGPILKRKKSFAIIMRKHMGAYVKNIPGGGALRVELMKTERARDVVDAVGRFLSTYSL